MRIMLSVCVSALVLALAGCGGGARPADRGVPDAPTVLSGCGPVAPAAIAQSLATPSVRQLTGQEICGWDGGTVTATYGWLPHDTLMNEAAVATRLGYRVEHVVVKKFGGFYWHDDRDPGTCGISTADTGTVTWWVRRESAGAADPCAAAYALMLATLQIDGT